MEVVEYMERGDYEQLVVCVDRSVGLRAFIAIHDTTLGPALGGCRIWPHPSEETALDDVLRLARAMTAKNAAAGLHLGGGKALIWADPRRDKSEAMLRSFSRFVDSLGGRYVTTEDVGSTTDDMVVVRQGTQHVVGLPASMGGSGDPSRATALGVYRGMLACVRQALRVDALRGLTVAMQGFGKVGTHLAAYLLADRARVIVNDVDPVALARAREMGCSVVEDPQSIYDAPCDIFSPCALGGTINRETIPMLRATVVAGAANNQLLTAEDGEELHRRGILYGPDFVLNAGGVINLSFEVAGGYVEEVAMERVGRISETVQQVFDIANTEEISTARAADRLAEARIQSVRQGKQLHLKG